MNLIIGDEFTPGFNLGVNKIRGKSKLWSQALNDETLIGSVRGSGITVPGKASLLHQVKQFSFAAYDRVLLFYGTNDYLHSHAGLAEVGQKLVQAIYFIRKHSYCQVYGILPLPVYKSNGHSYMQDRGLGGYTLQELVNMLDLTYSNHGINALNWLMVHPVVNQFNFGKRLINGRYPTKATSKLMASRVSDFLRQASHSQNQFSGVDQINDRQVKLQFSKPTKHSAKRHRFASSSNKSQSTSASSAVKSTVSSAAKPKFQSQSVVSKAAQPTDSYQQALQIARQNVAHASGAYAQRITKHTLNRLIKAHQKAVKTKSSKAKKQLKILENGILG